MSALGYNFDLAHYQRNNEGISKPYLVAALDILGFSNYVMMHYSNDILRDDVFWVLSEMQSIEDDLNDETTSIIARFFSDSLFLFLPLDYKAQGAEDTKTFLRTMTNLVDVALSNGFLVRGGLCIGECSIKKSMMWGPGIVKAHLLEEKIADSGRIVIEKQDYIRLLKYIEYVYEDDSSKFFSQFFVSENDGCFVFDSAEFMFDVTYVELDGIEVLERYKRHLSIVKENISYSSSEDKICKHLAKMSWHLRRYNEFAKLLGQPGISTETLS